MAMESLLRLAKRIGLSRSEPESPWGAPVTVDRGTIGQACLALDDQGQGSALWENGGKLWTMPVGPGSSPGLVRLPLGEGTRPQILLNPEGRGIILWYGQEGGGQSIHGKVLGGSADSAQGVFRTDGRLHHLQAAVDRRGNVLLVWLLEKEGRTEVMSHAFDTRTLAWEPHPTSLGFPSAPAVEPRIAMNHRQQAMVLWQAEGEPLEGLVASHYWPADRIWSDRPVPVVVRATRHHQVAMDDAGNALALWIHAPHGQRSSLEASYYDGKCCEWGDPEVLASAKTFLLPRLTMTGDGEALAAWCQAEEHGASRLITKAFTSGRWEEGVDCLELGQGPVRDFDLDLSVAGRAGLLAVHRGPEGDWVSARLLERVWSMPFSLAPASAAPCSAPRIRLCPQGASALWVQGVGAQASLVLADAHSAASR